MTMFVCPQGELVSMFVRDKVFAALQGRDTEGMRRILRTATGACRTLAGHILEPFFRECARDVTVQIDLQPLSLVHASPTESPSYRLT